MTTIDLTQADFRILQLAEQLGGITPSTNGSVSDYRRLAGAGFLEHQASIDTERFAITDKGREALAQTTWV